MNLEWNLDEGKQILNRIWYSICTKKQKQKKLTYLASIQLKSNLLFYYYLVCAFLVKHLATWRYMRGAVVSISVSLSLLICTRLIFNTNEKWNGVGGFFGSSHSLGLWNVLRSRLPVPDPRTVQVTTDHITGLYQLKWTEVVKSESLNFFAIWTEPFSRPKK